uniref:Methylmalonic aciduria and homocystinuria type D-like protein, mitochondrial n=1 Tax=Ascaris lumbricoides TaxID=6252 RepID=A0A0M3HVS0_ASCLU
MSMRSLLQSFLLSLLKVVVYCSSMRHIVSRMRAFSTQIRQDSHVVVYVTRDIGRQNTLLGPSKQFPFPGDVSSKLAFDLANEEMKTQPKLDVPSVSVGEILEKSTNNVKRSPSNPGDQFSAKSIELTASECPRLLKKDLKELFPGIDLSQRDICVINLTQKTDTDMSAWSTEMEIERMQLTSAASNHYFDLRIARMCCMFYAGSFTRVFNIHNFYHAFYNASSELTQQEFIESATAICDALHRLGYWADFIDPSSGRPYLGKFTNATLFETDDRYRSLGFKITDLGCCKYLGKFTNATLFETDDRYRSLGFKITDLGCCKILEHALWGTNAFVGTIFTDAPLGSAAVGEILDKILEHALWGTNAFVGTIFTDAPLGSAAVGEILDKVNAE